MTLKSPKDSTFDSREGDAQGDSGRVSAWWLLNRF
jgi:hypothetical protein